MPQFMEFKQKHGAAADCRPATDTVLAAYRTKLPHALIAEWEQTGWCAYGKGFIWLVNPDDLKSAVREWLGKSSKAIPFARSAFGQLFLWDVKGAHMLDPLYGTLAEVVDNIDIVFNYVLCQKQYLNDVLDHKLFVKAHKRLGPLAYDECYGFEPALALGGSGTLETLRKVKLREHLSILSQLIEEVKDV